MAFRSIPPLIRLILSTSRSVVCIPCCLRSLNPLRQNFLDRKNRQRCPSRKSQIRSRRRLLLHLKQQSRAKRKSQEAVQKRWLQRDCLLNESREDFSPGVIGWRDYITAHILLLLELYQQEKDMCCDVEFVTECRRF